MAKTKLLGEEREKQIKEQKKLAKKKNKKQRRSPGRFFKDVWGEIKKVTWPTRKDLFKTTFAVIVFIAIFAVIVGLMDWGLGTLFHNFFVS
ncbi:MAG: preprotein translocase subunit SecE [Christensenella sp.]|uniref:preprotein translocase subunit SecE n=1 Tax=Christensenella sp. TaxID=1935934 RepID=UPI002B202074|nr:preprotein translocase subunit SecE [Christensenella sp.]MEA5002991.1 preprotein translocase subunit SecE [Christensenella sp.]